MREEAKNVLRTRERLRRVNGRNQLIGRVLEVKIKGSWFSLNRTSLRWSDQKRGNGDSTVTISSWASEAIERIAALYAIEAEIRGSTPEVRRTIRQARARPLLDNMKTWLEATLVKLSRKSDTAAAIRYALSRWPALTRYADDGQLAIDNNASENF